MQFWTAKSSPWIGLASPPFYDLMKRDCPAVYYVFDILWLNGRDLRGLSLIERKKILRSVIPRKSSCIGFVSHIDRGALKLFELVKKSDLEGLIVKRKDGKYAAQTLWYKVLIPPIRRKTAGRNFFNASELSAKRLYVVFADALMFAAGLGLDTYSTRRATKQDILR